MISVYLLLDCKEALLGSQRAVLWYVKRHFIIAKELLFPFAESFFSLNNLLATNDGV